MTTIRLHNTKTKAKEDFTPIDPENVRMYVCGPTVYDRAHLGNARPVIVFDVLYRLLRHVYGADHVTYVRNFTDVDDKINAEAQRRKGLGDPRSLEELIRERTEETIGWYHADMDALGALRPNVEPRATDYIGQMIGMIAGLIRAGHAYAKEGHVLFRVRSYKDYGQLSGRSVDDMIAGARVEVAPFKEDPMDFVLWKPSDDDLPGWDSPWGRGRPGWHIECSAMSEELLGQSFDIHGGGIDLQFPHHENEIAQSMCAHPESGFANVWMHNEMLQVEGKKMSKSLGNFFTVRDLLESFEREFAIANIGPAIRLRFLMTHYRSPIDMSKSDIEAAATKIDEWLFWLAPYRSQGNSLPRTSLAVIGEPIALLSDDLNTSAVVAWIDKQIALLKTPPPNAVIINGHMDSAEIVANGVFAILALLGIDLDEAEGLRHSVWSKRLKIRALSKSPNLSRTIEQLLNERTGARNAKDFGRADAIRIGLAAAGVIVTDTPDGPKWELGPNFDPSKLESLK